MATAKQTKTARRNVSKAQEAAKSKRTLAHLPKETRTALGQQGDYGRAAPTKVSAYQPVSIGIFSTSIPVCGASIM